jgi:outer membrane protein insertion porin family
VSAAVALAALMAAAQLGLPAAPPPEVPVAELRILASPSEDVEQLQRVSGLQVGAPYRITEVRRAIKLLFSLGRFETVEVRARTDAAGVHLTLWLPPEPRLVEVRVLQSDLLDPADIAELTGLRLGAALERGALEAWSAALQRALVERGHRAPAVGLGLEAVDDAGGRALLVRIDEGPLTRLRQVVVRGRPRLPLWQLGRAVGVLPGEPLDMARIRPALTELLGVYRGLEYLDARVAEPVVREVGEVDGVPRADLVLDIDAGPKVRVRFKGHRAVPARELEADAAPLYEQGTGPGPLAEARERLLARYGRRGFWRAEVDVAARVTSNGNKKEVLFSIFEGEVAEVASLRFPGNHALDEGELAAQVHDTVARALASELGRPGADPEVVGLILGDRSSSGPRDSPQPDNTAPDPKRVYLPRAYRAAAEALADLYRAAGFQTVQVQDPIVKVGPGGARLDVQIPVKEGLQWRVGALSFSGNEAVPSAELLALSAMEPATEGGAALSFDKVEEARRAILTHYRDQGFLYVRLYEELRQVPPRGSLGWDYVKTSSTAPLDVRGVCRRAEEAQAEHCDVQLVFRVEEGVQVRARGLIVRGRERTRARVVESEVEVVRGAVLREADLTATRDNLLRVGVFERVDVHPLDEERMEAVKDVVVEVKERRAYALDAGAGASTAEGVRGQLTFQNGNILGTALRLQLQAKANYFPTTLLVLYDPVVRESIRTFYGRYNTFERLEYELAAGLSYPRIFGLPAGFSAGVDMIVLRELDPAFVEDTQRLTVLGHYKGYRPLLWGARRPLVLQARVSLDRSDLACNEDLSDRVEFCTGASGSGSQSVGYVSLGPRVSWDFRDDALDPTQGVYMDLTVEGAVGLGASSPSFVSTEGRVHAYVPVASRLTLAVAGIIGRIFPVDTVIPGVSEVPLNRRFFAGGRSTVRGYAERTLLPQDANLSATGQVQDTISTGGLSMLALKSELRLAVYGPLALALFYDVGDLWAGGQFSLSTTQTLPDGTTVKRSLAHGGGLGLRVATPIGPLALDLAIPFNKRDAIVNDAQLHFSVGAF